MSKNISLTNTDGKEESLDLYTIVLLQTQAFTKAYIVSKTTGEFITYHVEKNFIITKKVGYIELDPNQLYEEAEKCIKKAVDNFIYLNYDKRKIVNMAICTERNITVVWSKSTGMSLYSALPEDDVRCDEFCQKLMHKLWHRNTNYQNVVGLPMSGRWMGVKLRWLMDHVPVVSKALGNHDLMAGTLDSWLLWKLTTGTNNAYKSDKHWTDVTCAASTMLMNMHRCSWETNVCAFLEIDPTGNVLPTIRDWSAAYFGDDDRVQQDDHLIQLQLPSDHSVLPNIPIVASVSRDSATLFGVASVSTGSFSMTNMENAAFLLLSDASEVGGGRGRLSLIVGEEPVFHRSPIFGSGPSCIPISSVLYHDSDSGIACYSIEVPVKCSENLLQWLHRHRLAVLENVTDWDPVLISTAAGDLLDSAANNVPDSGNVCVVPAVVDGDQQLHVLGISPASSKPGHVVRAALEMVADETARLLDNVSKTAASSASRRMKEAENNRRKAANTGQLEDADNIMYVAGSDLAASDVFCQILADSTGRNVYRLSTNLPPDILGAVLLANRIHSGDAFVLEPPIIDKFECLLTPGELKRRSNMWEKRLATAIIATASTGGSNSALMNNSAVTGMGVTKRSATRTWLYKILSVFSIGLPFSLLGFGISLAIIAKNNHLHIPYFSK